MKCWKTIWITQMMVFWDRIDYQRRPQTPGKISATALAVRFQLLIGLRACQQCREYELETTLNQTRRILTTPYNKIILSHNSLPCFIMCLSRRKRKALIGSLYTSEKWYVIIWVGKDPGTRWPTSPACSGWSRFWVSLKTIRNESGPGGEFIPFFP